MRSMSGSCRVFCRFIEQAAHPLAYEVRSIREGVDVLWRGYTRQHQHRIDFGLDTCVKRGRGSGRQQTIAHEC